MHKNFQRDLRDINDEITKRDAGEASALHDQNQVVRAQLRLREIALLLDTTESPFFKKEEVGALIRALEPAFGATETQADGRSA